jgi:hypothetical protein
MAGRAPQNQLVKYYRPYDSADESGFESEAESEDSWYSMGADQEPPPTRNIDGHPDFRAFATKNQLMSAAGRSFSTIRDELEFNTGQISKNVTFSPYDAPPPDIEGEDRYGRTRFTTNDGKVVTLVMVDSKYRDRVAYPQPTLLTLRLPRIYKNVTNITLSDVKLLTSFYFFRRSKGNTDITVYEKGRQTLTYEGTLQSTIVKRFIAEGSYSIDQLLNEVQLQLNYTPLFYDWPNGFDDFVDRFTASGDFALNFNFPGDSFYNNVTNTYITNPTLDTITLRFWSTRYAGLTSYTPSQYILAYYYPVLNEYLFDENYVNGDINLQPGLGIDPAVTTLTEVEERILYNFSGINPPDPVVLAVINANILLLDRYRLAHTFRYWLINKYVVARDTRSQNVFITSPSLNTSLVNLLNSERVRFLTRALQINGITAAQYANLQNTVNRALAVISAMYSFEQERFLEYFAVPWTQYTLDYYADLNNILLLRNGQGAIGLASNDSSAIAQGVEPISVNILNQQRVNPTYYWPNLSNTSEDTIYLENLSSATSTFNLVYNMSTSNFLPNQTIVKGPEDYLYSEFLTKTANVVCPIQPAKYTTFKFRSPVRQTMQVETLPRPTIYRVPPYNQSNFDARINEYYDLSYSFVSSLSYTPNDPSRFAIAYDNLPTSNLFKIPGWGSAEANPLSPNYSLGLSLQSSIAKYNSSIVLDITAFPNRAIYATFRTPQFNPAETNSSFTYAMNLSVQLYPDFTSTNQTIAPLSNFQLFLYHDRGAFEGDCRFIRNENPKFFKTSTNVIAPNGSANISFTSYPNQDYFCIFRCDNSNYGTVYPRITPYFGSNFVSTQQTKSIAGINPETDILSPTFSNQIQSNFNYAQLYDSNFIRLPIQSNLWGPEPSDNIGNQDFAISNVPIGYDTFGVSTDYTDYVPYVYDGSTITFSPSCNLAIDPINKYLFQSNTPYNSTTQTFFYTNSDNAIFDPGLTDIYYPEFVLSRQYKIAQYYTNTYIPESTSNKPLASGLIGSLSNAQLPYTVSTTMMSTIQGYDYAGAQSTIQLNRGVLGFNFIPQEGVWDIQRVVFRSAIEDSNNDPNKGIQYLGVFNMGAILGCNTQQFSMCNAIALLSNSARVSYTSTITLSNYGFDTKGGTYYEFIKDSNFVSEEEQLILGYDQRAGTISAQPESMYTLIAFNQYGTPTPIKALSGAAVPYPFYNSAAPSTNYIDGTSAYNSNQGVVIPSSEGPFEFPWIGSQSTLFGPSSSNAFANTQSQYALSMPIGTSVLNIKAGQSLAADSNYLLPWNITTTPTNTIATVPNFLMLQDTNFNIYTYDPLTITRQLSTPTWELSADQIYPSYENTALVAAGGNCNYYYFLGFSNSNDLNINFSLRIKRFSPISGVLYDYPLPGSFNVPIGGTVKGFTINDAEQMVLSYQDPTNTTKLYYNLLPSTTLFSQTIATNSTAIIGMDQTTSTLYYMPQDAVTNQGIDVYRWPLDNSVAFPGSAYTPVGLGLPNQWNSLAVNVASNIPEDNDRIFLISQEPGFDSNVYYTTNWNATTWDMAKVSTPITNTAGAGQPIGSITGGYDGSFWLTAQNQPMLWGNRNTLPDQGGLIDTAWQIFYPFQKIVLNKLSNSYNAITDLSYLDYPEWPHTAMFYYRSTIYYEGDTSNKWGLESSNNFYVGDPNMSGYYFNSYIFNVPVQKSLDSNDYQYLTVRGYTPTESSQVLLRFVLPNAYDFGYLSQNDIIEEAALLDTSNIIDFNSNFASALSNFNISFQQSNSFFGAGFIPNFDGSNFNSSNFAQFASNYSTIYQSYQSNANLLNSITQFVNSNLQLFVSTQLGTIIPDYAIGRASVTDPILFSLFWKTGLLPQYRNLMEDWGLGYNLGYAKVDTPFSTYHRAPSFYKILDDYIFLRLNPQYQLNRMDNTYNENFKITRDSTGQVQNFHGKLLLNNFNTYSQSFIFNNQPFNPPIGRLDHLYFQWVNVVGDTIDNDNCDWSATVVITEDKPIAATSSTLPALPPMTFPRK